MTGDRLPSPIVVAVDNGDRADDAVDWAAAEAAERGSPLVVVHVFHPPLALDAYGFIPLTDTPPGAQAAGAEVLRASLRRAAAVASELEVYAQLISGVPTRVLPDLSRGAALLVLGSRSGRSGRGHNVLTGSVAGQLVARASCPVVVIRRRPRTPGPGPARPRVVVGIDLTRCCSGALDVAFRAAAQRGIPVTAVHAWGADTPADLEGVCGSRPVTEARARRKLALLLEPWQEQFAGVPVHPRVVRADPADALVAESEGAALVVVGSRGRGSVRGTLFGSVSRSLVQRARSPLVVVRPDQPTGEPRKTTSIRRRPLPDARTEWSPERGTPWK